MANEKSERYDFLRFERTEALMKYLMTCIKEKDWHGVSDAANDLREVDAEMRGLEK